MVTQKALKQRFKQASVPKEPSPSTHLGITGAIKIAFNALVNTFSSYEENNIDCIICMESFPEDTCFNSFECKHDVCCVCLRKHLQTFRDTTHQNNLIYMACPGFGCLIKLRLEDTLRVAYSGNQKKINDWWTTALRTSFIQNKIICPYDNCKAMFDVGSVSQKKCKLTECLECHRGMCVACEDKWHPGVHRKFDDRKALLKTLSHAKRYNFTRCPSCSNMIEKNTGCVNLLCRCGTVMCYRCGGHINKTGCSNNCHSLNNKATAALRAKMFEAKNYV